jgi:co-chaperonin GroES (HSP10)
MNSNNDEATTIKPLQDRVVVRRLTDEESGTKSASGIIIPDTVSKEPLWVKENGMRTEKNESRWM